MQITINKWLLIAVLIGVGILIFTLIRGCHNQRGNTSLAVNYKERINKLEQDTATMAKQLAAYMDTMQFTNGQLSLSNNKLLFLNEDLGRANDRITILLKKHIPITPSSDTNVTTVPNEYISDCSGCFQELGSGRDLVKKYKAEKENQEKLFRGQLNVKDNRIRSLEESNIEILGNYINLIDSSKQFQDKFIPRGRLYLSWGVLWAPWPTAAGAGLMYRNKRNMLWGAKWYYGDKGHMIETTINFPLSFKMK